jgi:hypothetical protein
LGNFLAHNPTRPKICGLDGQQKKLTKKNNKGVILGHISKLFFFSFSVHECFLLCFFFFLNSCCHAITGGEEKKIC